MKKTILIVALVVTAFVSKAQSKDSSKIDINTMPLISINDLNTVDSKLFGDMPSKYIDAIRAAFQQLVNQKVAALAPKPQPKTEPVKKK